MGFLQEAVHRRRDGPGQSEANSVWVALTSKSRELLRGVQILLLNLGIAGWLMDALARGPGRSVRYGRGTDARRLRSDGVLYELGVARGRRATCSAGDRIPERQAGSAGRRRGFEGFYREKVSDVVVAVEAAGGGPYSTSPSRGASSMIANGFVVHQCGEQPLAAARRVQARVDQRRAVRAAGRRRRVDARLGRAGAGDPPRRALPRRRAGGEPVSAGRRSTRR